jgi:transposase
VSRKYLPVNRDQPMMLPEDMRLWIEKDHLAWFVIDVIEGLDLTALRSLGKPGRGRPGYDPVMLAVLLIYAYLQAERSSRKIEQRCRTDAAFRVVTGNRVPDHSTICRFRAAAAGPGGPLEDLFARVLFVLAAAGLGRLDVISVDGSKIWADASKQANRTEEGLRKLARKILDDAARADGEDCGCDGHEHGQAAGLDGPQACGCCDGGRLPGLGLDGPAVPRGGWGGASRAHRIAAGLADLEAARIAREEQRRGAAEAYLAAARAGTAPRGAVPREVAVEVAQLRLERAAAADAATDSRWAAAGRRLPGSRREGAQSARTRKAREQLAAAVKARKDNNAADAAKAGKNKEPQPVRNITDPDSRVMHCTLRGLVQAYNCQVPRTADGVFLLPRATRDANDAAQVTPALSAIARSQEIIAAGHATAGRPGLWSRVGTILFDPGYFSKDNIQVPGPDRLIGTGGWKDTTPQHSPGCTHDDPRDQMAHHLSTRQGRDLYRHRAPVSEGGFADLKERTGLRQFAMRGLPKVNGELLLACMSANIHLLYRRTRPA